MSLDRKPGRYWITFLGGEPVGVILQSPLQYKATMTPMPGEAITAVVDVIVQTGIGLPGLTGEAATAARFAGQWAERTGAAVRPVLGLRIYEILEVVLGSTANGRLRRAEARDQDRLVHWFERFQDETGEGVGDPVEVIGRRLSDGEIWVWDDGGLKTMTGVSQPVGGVVRVGPVYTPPELRNRGYATSCVGGLSRGVRSQKLRCILYADLSKPTSNSIYRSLGYRPVAEILEYRIDRPDRANHGGHVPRGRTPRVAPGRASARRPSLDVTLRTATAADLPAVVRLLADDELGRAREDGSEPLADGYRQAFAAIEEDPRQVLVVADSGQGVVGTLQLSFIPSLTFVGGERAQIEAVRVDRALRRQGVGRGMIEWAIEQARSRGCHMVQLTTNKRRADSRQFYASIGFEDSHIGMKLIL